MRKSPIDFGIEVHAWLSNALHSSTGKKVSNYPVSCMFRDMYKERAIKEEYFPQITITSSFPEVVINSWSFQVYASEMELEDKQGRPCRLDVLARDSKGLFILDWKIGNHPDIAESIAQLNKYRECLYYNYGILVDRLFLVHIQGDAPCATTSIPTTVDLNKVESQARQIPRIASYWCNTGAVAPKGLRNETRRF